MFLKNKSVDLKTLKKIYIEVTNSCNLNCKTCIRNIWDEKESFISKKTFTNILKSIVEITPLPTVFIGGFGEPLNHPDILEMVAELKKLNVTVEFITNGILLNKKISLKLIELELDRLWVSIDGATPESYLDIRLGSNLPLILSNLKELQKFKNLSRSKTPKIGIAFVALKHNISDLPKVLEIGSSLGADEFSISNVLPYTKELNQQVLYNGFIGRSTPASSNNILPPMEIDINILGTINNALRNIYKKKFSESNTNYFISNCPFIEKKSTAIRHDGALSPCLPFMHRHEIFFENRLRVIEPYIIGNINQDKILDLWNNDTYRKHRESVFNFDFLCTACALCFEFDSNDCDCFSYNSPVCGGCLWAMGFIKCP